MCYVRAITPTGPLTSHAPAGPLDGTKPGQSDDLETSMLAATGQARGTPSGDQQSMMDELLMGVCFVSLRPANVVCVCGRG
ncbi:hypothetical protein BC830DRAFT_1125330 [Chytriomyces sp. MP71]|nr:hypothetical protein BC830DRAFT_1125330 [Chytriomyces sp. MP71]